MYVSVLGHILGHFIAQGHATFQGQDTTTYAEKIHDKVNKISSPPQRPDPLSVHME